MFSFKFKVGFRCKKKKCGLQNSNSNSDGFTPVQMEDPSAGSVDGGGGTASVGPAVQVADICSSSLAAPLRLLEWKIKVGSVVNVDSVLALCTPVLEKKGTEAVKAPEKKVRSDRAGVITELCFQLGQVIPPGWVTLVPVTSMHSYCWVLLTISLQERLQEVCQMFWYHVGTVALAS